MGAAAICNLTMECGTTWYQGTTYQNNDGTPIDITGYEFSMDITNVDVPVEFVTVGPAGQVTFKIAATDTSNISPGIYDYRILFTDTGGNVDGFLKGTLTVND
jgi:hypothetical protein